MVHEFHLVGANLIEKDGKILLIQETLPIAYGLWNFPAGKLDFGESLTECAAREAKEESGLDIVAEYLVGVYHHAYLEKEKQVDTIVFVFKSKILGGELIKPNDEVMDIQWFSPDEIKKMLESNQLRRPFIWQAIQDYQNGKKIPLEYIKYEKI